jgi:hypothetical protein
MKNPQKLLDVTRISPAIFMAIMLAAIMTRPADASPLSAVYQVDVTYTQGSVTSGPLSFGLSELPDSVSATFILGAGYVDPNYVTIFGSSDVISADVTFGDATWDVSLLDSFSMSLSSGNVGGLNYEFLPITTQYSDGGIVLNFPLSITGTDIASGQSFEYGYTESTQEVSAAAVPVPAAAWLFGSALGLLGWMRRKQAV